MRKAIKERKINLEALKNVYILYTVLFIFLILIVFLPFIINGKTFIWEIDGINQHFPILQYYGNILRETLSGHTFPMIDYKIGLGFDTITTLHYYAIGDPIALLTIFMNPENAIFMYGLLIILRYYLIGISYIIFARYFSLRGNGVLLGALIYTFSGYALYAGVRHPFFLNPMIYLPIIIIGLEEVMQRKKPYILILMTFVSTLSNFYFLYILTIISIIYVIYRYFTKYHSLYKKVLTGFFLNAARTGLYYILGIAMAAVIFVPVVYAFTQIGRLDSNQQLLTGFFHYPKRYYLKLLQGFIASGVSPGYWVELSFLPIVCISLVILLCNRKYKKIALVVILSFLALLIPAFGYLMNGFSYITNRWCFILGFIISIVFTTTYDKILKLRKKETLLLVIGTMIYGIIAYYFPAKNIVKLEFFILIITIILVLILQDDKFRIKPWIQKLALFLLVITSLGFQGYAYYSPLFSGYVNEFLTKDEINNETKGEIAQLIKGINDQSFYRIETYGDKVKNEALIIGYNDVSGYFSMVDGNIATYFEQLELLNQRNTYRFDNLDNRTILDSLLNVKYFATTNKTAVPYGYKLIKEEQRGDKSYYLYENLYTLPLGYVYDEYLLLEDYNKLSPLEKQDVMLQAIVVENAPSNIKEFDKNIGKGIQKLHFNIRTDDNIILTENSIKVLNKDASIFFDFQAPGKSEIYLRLNNFDIKNRQASMTTIKAKGEKEVTKYVNVRSRYHNTYFRNNYLINTGYSRKEKSWIKLSFPKKETYSYHDIEIFALDMDRVKKPLQKLQQTTFENVNVSKNKIQGSISMDKEGVLLISIPYSKGWRAYVNKESVEILKGNISFLALPLDVGNHEIVLEYETPYLKAGAIISAISFTIFIGIIIYNSKIQQIKKRNIKQREDLY